VGHELLVLVLGEGAGHRLDEHPVEVAGLEVRQRPLVQLGEPGRAEVAVPLGLEVVVGHRRVRRQLLLVRQIGAVRDREPRRRVDVRRRHPAGRGAEDGPLHERLHGPREVVVQRGDGDIGAGVRVVDRVHLGAGDQRLAGVELPAEERVDDPADRHDLGAGLGGEEVVRHRVAAVHGLVRVELHHHRLGADRQRAGEHVVAVDGLLQVH
jgi:hypothetical protein